MWRNKTCKDVSIFMLLLQAIGYFSGVMFIFTEKIESLMLNINYYSGLCIATITTIGWIVCDRHGKKTKVNKSK
jgi:hypothetical protein